MASIRLLGSPLECPNRYPAVGQVYPLGVHDRAVHRAQVVQTQVLTVRLLLGQSRPLEGRYPDVGAPGGVAQRFPRLLTNRKASVSDAVTPRRARWAAISVASSRSTMLRSPPWSWSCLQGALAGQDLVDLDLAVEQVLHRPDDQSSRLLIPHAEDTPSHTISPQDGPNS